MTVPKRGFCVCESTFREAKTRLGVGESTFRGAKTRWELRKHFGKAALCLQKRKIPFQQAHKRSGPYRDLAIGLAPDKGQRLGRGHGSVAVPELAPCLEALAHVWSPFSYLQKCVCVCRRLQTRFGFTKALFERKTHFPKARFAFLSHLERKSQYYPEFFPESGKRSGRSRPHPRPVSPMRVR